MQQRVSVQKAVPSAYAWAFKEALLDLLIAHVPCALSQVLRLQRAVPDPLTWRTRETLPEKYDSIESIIYFT